MATPPLHGGSSSEMHLPAGARESFEVLSGLSEPLAPHTADSRRVTDLLDANLDHKRHFREPRDYTIIKSLGTGSFGTVYVADWQSPLPSGAMVPAMQHSLTRPAYAGKRLVAIKRMKKPFAAWEDCIKLNELRVRAAADAVSFVDPPSRTYHPPLRCIPPAPDPRVAHCV